MRLVVLPLTIATTLMVVAVSPHPARADCAEDLTRIQTAAANASPDIRTTVEGLAATAQARLKAMDANGCRTATAEALKLMGLAPLAPLVLSTPVPGIGRDPHPPAPSASGQASAPAPAAPSGAGQPQQKSDAGQKAAPAAPASPATPSAPAIPSTSQTPAKDAASTKTAGGPDWYIVTSDFIGRPVTSQDNPGDSIGVIKGVVIDSNTQQALLALVETGGFLGIGADLIAVPFSALMFNARWDRPAIGTNAEVIQSGPRVTLANVSSLVADPNWRKQVSEHFGVPLVAPAAATPPPTSPIPAPPAAAPPVAAPKKTERPAAPAPAAAPAGDPAKGHEYAKMMCSGCHTFDADGGTRVGPNLHNVLGRPVASMAGFTYSQGLKKHGGSWDPASLDTFLQSPQHFASGTVMAFPGIPSAEDRANVIAYLRSIETAQGAQK